MRRPPVAPGRSRPAAAALAVVAIITALAFAPSLRDGFVDFDDQANFVDNLRFRGLGPPQLRWMATAFHLGHWHPLTWLTFGVDHALWGMAPAGYHLTSVLWHVANAVLVAVLGRRLLVRAGVASPGRELAAALGALLWAVHPLRVESVTWITERRDVVSGCFLLLAVLAYERRPAGPAALVCAALALLGKASAMVLPALLLVLDVWPLGRLGGTVGWTTPAARRVWLEKIPFVALAVAGGVVALFAQRAAGALRSFDVAPLAARIGAAMYQPGFYLWKTLLPVSLLPIYEYPTGMGPTHPLALAGAATTLALVALAWLARRRAPAFVAAVAAYLVAMGPTLGVAQSGPQVAADRYTYLPTIGLSLMVGAAAAAGRARAAAAVAIVAVLAVTTGVQTTTWKDARTLWSRAVRVAPDNAFAQYRLAAAERAAGDDAAALARLREAVRLRPLFPEAENDLAAVLQARGAYDEALAHHREAVRANPHFALGWTSMGATLAAMGRTDDALAAHRQALAVDPGLMEAHANLGALLDQLGRSDEAMREYEEALRIRPSAEVLNNVAIVLAQRGQQQEAAARYREAIALRPDVAAIHVNLAYVLIALGDRAGARGALETALRIEPGQAAARATLDSLQDHVPERDGGRE